MKTAGEVVQMIENSQGGGTAGGHTGVSNQPNHVDLWLRMILADLMIVSGYIRTRKALFAR